MKIKQVAAMLGVCEFDVFRQAYAAWYEAPADDETVGKHFMDYADEGVTPLWVNQYVKAIVSTTDPVAAVA